VDQTGVGARSAQRLGRGGVRTSVALVAAVAVAVPVIILFVQLWGARTEGVTFASAERDGIIYLDPLSKLVMALTDAQSAAVNGASADRPAIERVASEVDDVDRQYGGGLRTTERWTRLRDDVNTVTGQKYSNPADAYTRYGQLVDASLALVKKVGDESNLILDPQLDSYYVMSASLLMLPQLVVNSRRVSDLAQLAATTADPQQRALYADHLGASRVLAVDANTELSDGLSTAFNATERPGLRPALLAKLDALQSAVDQFIPANSLLPGAKVDNNPAAVAKLVGDVRTAAADLESVLLDELDTLVKTRLDDLSRSRIIAIAPLVLALVLLAGLALAALLSGRTPRRTPSGRNRPAESRAARRRADPAAVSGQTRRDDPRVLGPRPNGLGPADQGPQFGDGSDQLLRPPLGEDLTTHSPTDQERSGASR
jgi:hypothetical protein